MVQLVTGIFIEMKLTKPILEEIVGMMGGVRYGALQTLTINPTKDVWFKDVAPGNFNSGADTVLRVGENNASVAIWRALIHFDLSSIPPGSLILSDQLKLYMTLDASDHATVLSVYRIKRVWVEGTRIDANDTPATGATWVRFNTTDNWQTPGAFGANDCEQTAIGSINLSATETINAWKVITLNVNATKQIVDGIWTDNGLLLKTSLEADDGYYFSSREAASNKPVREVAYRVHL
jgi:hypothetical protein